MELEPDEIGRRRFGAIPGHWEGNARMQTALFAGQPMLAVEGEQGGYSLHYLGFVLGGFGDLAAARAEAAPFAKAVLERLVTLLAPEPPAP